MNLVKFTIIIVLLPILFITCTNKKKQNLHVKNLTCEYLTNPVGIESQIPEFSWQIKSDEREQIQKAYQILVASSPELLNAKSVDLWNTGKV